MNTRKKKWLRPLFVVVLALVAGVIASPKATGISWIDSIVGKTKINMGLDLQGGVHLVYEADMSGVEKGKEAEALSGIQDVIERRVNAYGVGEPLIQPSKVGSSYRLIVELAGVKDLEEAKQLIKETPFLEFKEQGETKEELGEEEKEFVEEQVAQAQLRDEETEKKAIEVLARVLDGEDFEALAKEFSDDPSGEESGGDLDFFKKGAMVPEFEEIAFGDGFGNGEIYPELVKSQFGIHIIKKIDERGEGDEKEVRAAHILLQTSDPEQFRQMITEQLLQPQFESSGLTGQHLKRSQVDFDPQTNKPVVLLQFNSEGKDLFKDITERNVGKQVAIYLDNEQISAPVVNDVIRNGEAVISGKFVFKEAQELSRRLNAGALPVPIKLVSQQSIEASLGQEALDKSLKAGFWGLVAVGIFMVLYYRLAGLVAVIALSVYITLLVSIFKLSSLSPYGVTLTLSGIAGFILSVGMAVDANILIFERTKEEIRRGRDLKAALDEGFKRAWTSIRDGNLSTILTSVILIMFGTGFIQGFAITLTIGVLVSMFTAIVVTRVLLDTLMISWFENRKGLVLVSSPSKLKKEKE